MPTLSGCNLELVKRPSDGASFFWSVGTCTGKFERRSFDLLGHGAQNDTPMGKEWHPKTGALLSKMHADRYAVCDWLLDPANAFTLRHERDLHTGGVISADKVSLFRADTESAGRAHIKAWAALNGADVVALIRSFLLIDIGKLREDPKVKLWFRERFWDFTPRVPLGWMGRLKLCFILG